MKAKDAENVRHKIDAEGFDYCFRYYSHFPEVKDEEFHKLRVAYVQAAKDLEDYIGLEE